MNGMLQISREEGILIATIDGVGDPSTTDRLADRLEDLGRELLLATDIRVVVLTGMTEDAFRGEQGGRAVPTEDAVSGAGRRSLAEPVAALELPVIAAIPGEATGPGLELALACDLRVAAETATFGLHQILDGQIPGDGGTQRLSRLVGKAKAMEMILTGRPIDALEALRIGLVNRICPGGEVTATALALARELAGKAPIALRYAKEAVLEGTEMTLDQGLRLEGDLYLLLQTTRDREEGIGAFHRKEAPRFEGR